MTPDHPDYGKQVKIERDRREVRVVFVTGSVKQADALYADLSHQLKTGVLAVVLTGKPMSGKS